MGKLSRPFEGGRFGKAQQRRCWQIRQRPSTTENGSPEILAVSSGGGCPGRLPDSCHDLLLLHLPLQ
eukprot:Skav200665  [mRNA]  locus=scaffold1967:24206:25530:- [translate_table: standard]